MDREPFAAAGAGPGTPAAVVRPACPADVPRVWELLLGLADYERLRHEVTGSPERLAEHLFGPRPWLECLVAESGQALVGYALFYPTYSSFRTVPTMWLEDLFVVPAERGRGAGRALLAAVAQIALARGFAALDWNVLDWNQPSIDFYRKLGARPVGEAWLEYGLDREALRALADARARAAG